MHKTCIDLRGDDLCLDHDAQFQNVKDEIYRKALSSTPDMEN
jgi:hypothetical protein